MQRKIYNTDPRCMLNLENTVFVKAEKFINAEPLNDEDTIVYEMPTEQKESIHQLIEEYDKREPFDVEACKIQFEEVQNSLLAGLVNRVPAEIYSQIADHRVFVLGYCTKEMLGQLKRHSKKNEKWIQQVDSEYYNVQLYEGIPEKLLSDFGFHDCKVLNVIKGNDIIITFDNSGGFTNYNKLIFHDAKISCEENIEGSYWIYEELYKKPNGYEAHMLFSDAHTNHDLIVSCSDITFDIDKGGKVYAENTR
ncbi:MULTISPECIES: DUF4085 family protein [unclassified Fusibacter]|uniref:DUF4085 family protein n=1 Tax=unclassified Fusibacter TaxID=2624464 RepID=UPI001011A9BA|nr:MULTISPECIES: DUF4085 family protein [unclassified Fusibacter]MCK8061141.1 DUF4085 domain-containing protein [Fusibacter sp. A2]NPE23323.1 DUF4085 family protein [Fusibacter sp. A1]RXV59365.1 DUF4085 family protein [Fusibacter sp. A1]